MMPTTHATHIGLNIVIIIIVILSLSPMPSLSSPLLSLIKIILIRDLLDYLGPRGHLDGSRLIIERVKPEDKGVYRYADGDDAADADIDEDKGVYRSADADTTADADDDGDGDYEDDDKHVVLTIL